jgi:flagellar biosynthesis/type III secretory pathway chaperone
MKIRRLNMASCLPQLVTVLTSKRTSMEELLVVLKDEQRSIIEIDLMSLETLDYRKRDLLTAMDRNNAECRLLYKEAAVELKLDKAETLSPIISKASPPVREILKSLQAKLLEHGDAMNRLLDFNRELLEGSLRHVRETLAFFNSVMQTRSSTYGDAGRMITAGNEVRLVCKEA